MLILPNDCRCSEPIVFPSNWKTKDADISLTWYISYRFYPAGSKEGVKKIHKAMNSAKTLRERRKVTETFLEQLNKGLREGFNPITKKYPNKANGLLPAGASWLEALEYARQKKQCVNQVKLDMKSVIKYVSISAANLHIDHLPLTDLSRKHMKLLFEQLKKDKGEAFTGRSHNRYRSYLMILFEELVSWELMSEDIDIMKWVKVADHIYAKTPTLTPEQVALINEKLPAMNYPFWRFIQLFFHSGSRATEIMAVRFEDVDLTKQTIRYKINKGKVRYEYRVIKDIILPLWTEIVQTAKPWQYLFSEGLTPGDSRIRTDQIRHRWALWVQKKLGIKGVGIYCLKHMNSQQISDLLDIETAARLNAHDPEITKRHYANNSDVLNERLKKVGNVF